MPIILIGISIIVFFMFANPMYSDILQLRDQAASYDKALSNAKEYKNEIDELTQKDNDINPDDKIKLQKLLPDNVDNIRLILEIEQIALPYGMALKDVKYSAIDPAKSGKEAGAAVQAGKTTALSSKDYGVWDLSFSTTGTYDNFLSFTRDLEKNLRIVDVSSIQFSSGTTASATPTSPSTESYKYDFKIKTYWLKN
ncbi:hypothetical protein A3A03_02600 [Candidatus Nomurabacteria bacterium RIFCSPLOWO2_01_FULL_40_18]|uniref:Type 4a pilus biogenesis protein PilO n=1 Tax=Candidatus Nomurabacteria bacterium RIFCSPLOWO2_01_FULL_40_18 TaxID=1801773 RepID=A0A1F6XKC1_9BACT|nr:MAG: hypothetical protein A3A03_02600 [Candidatus Nomurabacteria bacterium RIFCSPLOWO2_01_FULL_40_18]